MTEEFQTESIGARLHKARLKRKATIEQVYKDIKIHPKIVSALEEDRYDDFLNPTYVKAFLKSYCRYLKIDANRILTDYDKLKKETAKQPSLEIKFKQESAGLFSDIDWQRYLLLGKKWMLPILSGILVVFLGIFLLTFVSRAIKKVKESRFFRPKIAAVTEPKEPTVIKPLSIPQGQPLTLIVKTKGDVWLEVKSDGKTVFRSILKKGSTEIYKADEKFQLWTGKGEYLDLILNGNSLGSPGGGVIKNIILTREGLKIEKR